GSFGRKLMAIRDMDIAAELIGIRLLPTKLAAFAISSYFCGVAGALLIFMSYGSAEPEVFNILNASFPVLFMIIIGGLGSIIGSFLGAAFIVVLPIMINTVPGWFGIQIMSATVEHFQFMITGALIIFFLIVEPAGLARLWAIAREKLRLWPFPY
ncbi:MAG: branched-chain amino acid ABC transporter permease, partial [Pseudomonadota bacterium]